MISNFYTDLSKYDLYCRFSTLDKIFLLSRERSEVFDLIRYLKIHNLTFKIFPRTYKSYKKIRKITSKMIRSMTKLCQFTMLCSITLKQNSIYALKKNFYYFLLIKIKVINIIFINLFLVHFIYIRLFKSFQKFHLRSL